MSDIVKYNPDDPLFSEPYLEEMFVNDYKQFKQIAKYIEETNKKLFNSKFLPIIMKKVSKAAIDSGFDSFDNSYRGSLKNNKIEFQQEWELNAFLHIPKHTKSFFLYLDVAYMGPNFNIKFDKKYTVLGLKYDNEVRYLRTDITSKRKFDASRYYSSAYFGIEPYDFKNMIHSDEVMLKINSEFEDHIFKLTLATMYGLINFYNVCIHALEKNTK